MSRERPWAKWFFSDWRADAGLRACTLAARGLWKEMLCLMHDAEPYGHLTLNGKPLTETQIAFQVGGGVTVSDVAALLTELEGAGVFSRNKNGVIFSRRMLKDQEKSEADRDNGKRGGNPRLKRGVNPPDKAHMPEARDQNIDIADAISSSPASPSMSFDDFWKIYPRKEGKQAAEREFKRQRAKLPPAAELKASIDRYIANKKPDIDYCHPRTWLSQGRWLDEIGDKTPAPVEEKYELPADAPQWRKNLLAQLGAVKYKSWIVATEMRGAERKGHFYVKTNFAATYLAGNLLKEIALAVGCEEREIIFHVRPQKEPSK